MEENFTDIYESEEEKNLSTKSEENKDTEVVDETENAAEALSENSISLQAYDSYTYYDKVLQSLNNIQTNENTIMENQQTIIGLNNGIIAVQNNCNSIMSCLVFIIAIVFVYEVMRNAIIVDKK